MRGRGEGREDNYSGVVPGAKALAGALYGWSTSGVSVAIDAGKGVIKT
jgi:hypothetical protein